MGRCLSEDDAEKAGAWLLDRLSRLEPSLNLTLSIEPGGGQYLLVLST